MAMNINEMLKKAKRLQGEMEKEEQELGNKEFFVELQGIKVIILGNYKIKSIKLNEALIDPDDPELIEDLIVVAINQAIDLVNQAHDEISSKFSPAGM